MAWKDKIFVQPQAIGEFIIFNDHWMKEAVQINVS